MKLPKNNRGSSIADLFSLALIALCTFIITVACPAEASYYDITITDFSKGWETETNKTVSLDELPEGDIVITHDLTNTDIYRKRLCFFSTHTHIIAEFDGVTGYSFAPKFPNIIGKSYGMYIHMIRIPEGAKTVTLRLHPIYENSAASLTRCAVEDAGIFMADIYGEGLPKFALCMIIVMFGFLMLIIGTANLSVPDENNINFFSLGVFAILVGVWTTNETMVLQVFTQRPEIVRFLVYLCLIFIAYPPASFMASATNQRDTLFLPILRISTALNFVLTISLAALGVCDIRSMLTFSHVNIVLTIIALVYLMARASREKTVDPAFLRVVILAISPAAIGVLLDLIRFRVFPMIHFDASLFTKLGMVVFIGFMGFHLIRDRTRRAVARGQAELMEKMAYTDGLTELGNRAAFHETEKEIIKNHYKCIIIQLDINDLKKVNDMYGHSEGDRHITGAAQIIRESFRDIGLSYRTGGDEFIAVVRRGGLNDVERAIKQMEQRVDDYNEEGNPPVPLQIAYGFAECVGGESELEEAEKLADKRMYEKKRQMKILHSMS